MATIYLVQHSYEHNGAEESKLIGAYESEPDALAARARAAILPGFADHPNAFHIDALALGKDAWTEGFVTVGRDAG